VALEVDAHYVLTVNPVPEPSPTEDTDVTRDPAYYIASLAVRTGIPECWVALLDADDGLHGLTEPLCKKPGFSPENGALIPGGRYGGATEPAFLTSPGG